MRPSWCPEEDSNLHALWALLPESSASTNSAIWACLRSRHVKCWLGEVNHGRSGCWPHSEVLVEAMCVADKSAFDQQAWGQTRVGLTAKVTPHL